MVLVSSDAFTYWGKQNAKNNNQELRIMYSNYSTNYLPKIAKELCEIKKHYTAEFTTQHLHNKGINCRDFGVVRSKIKDVKRRKVLLIDCTARSVRFLIKSSLSKLFKAGTLDLSCFNGSVEQFFSETFFSSENFLHPHTEKIHPEISNSEKNHFVKRWKDILSCLLDKFKDIFSPEESHQCEKQGLFSFFDDKDLSVLFSRICNICHVHFHQKEDLESMDSSPNDSFHFSHDFDNFSDEIPLDYNSIKNLNKNEIVCKILPSVKFVDFLNPIDEILSESESPVLKRTETIGRLADYSKQQFREGFNLMMSVWGDDEEMKNKFEELFKSNDLFFENF